MIRIRQAVRAARRGARGLADHLRAGASGSAHGERFAFRSPAEIFDELAALSAGGIADYSGITYERIERQMGVFWPCPAPGPSRHAAALRGRTLPPPRRPRPLPRRRLPAAGRGRRRRVPDHPHHRARRVAVPLRHADAPHRPAGGAVSRAARRDAPAAGRAARRRRRRPRPRREPARRARAAGARRGDDPARHRVHPVPLAGRAVGEPAHGARLRPDRRHPGVQGGGGAPGRRCTA